MPSLIANFCNSVGHKINTVSEIHKKGIHMNSFECTQDSLQTSLECTQDSLQTRLTAKLCVCAKAECQPELQSVHRVNFQQKQLGGSLSSVAESRG